MLTDKQEKFCVNVATGMTLIDAYKNSYNTQNMVDNSIYCESSKLMDNPKIIQRVEELRKEIRSDKIMSAAQRKEYLSNMILNDIDANRTDKLKALDILNKMDGEYITKVEANVTASIEVDIEDE